MKIENLVRKNILGLKPYTAARHSHHNGILLDANENSFGSTLIGDVPESINRYPDPYQKNLRGAISPVINVPQDNLFFGVGSDEIIDLLIRIFCAPSKDNIIICEPTYGMYQVACDINDVAVKNIPLNEKFDLEYAAIENAVDENTKMMFVCSPNNPTGNLLDKDIIFKLTDLNAIIVVDEAYIDFSKDNGFAEVVNKYPNLVVMRTFSKAWGLAGVRCGYCVSSVDIINILFKIKAPYNIGKLTSDAVCAAVKNIETRNKYIELILSERKRVVEELKINKKILNVLHSDSNFISFKVDEPKKVFSYLENSGVIIRDRSSQFNFSGYLRVTVGTNSENDLFLNKLNEIL